MADVLLVIDLQNGVCYGEQTAVNMPQVIAGVNARIAAYRKAKKADCLCPAYGRRLG